MNEGINDAGERLENVLKVRNVLKKNKDSERMQ